MSLPTPEVEVLSQLIDDENGHYRFRVKQQVHYLTISSDTFDEDTMCRPYLLTPNLPAFPESPWTTMDISRGEDDSLVTRVSTNPLPGINVSWHHRCIDVLSLQRTKRFNSGVYEIQYNGVPCVAKIARFGWDIPRIEHETWVYSILAGYQKNHPNEPIAPTFLGHLTENDRVMGFLLQKVDGERACIDDLADRTALLNRLYSLDFVHGNVNRHNFLVGRVSGGSVHLIDFEHVALFEEGLAEKELLSLPVELTEETGRGSTV